MGRRSQFQLMAYLETHHRNRSNQFFFWFEWYKCVIYVCVACTCLICFVSMFRSEAAGWHWPPISNDTMKRSKHNTTTRYRYYQHYPPPMLNQCSVHIEQTKLCLPVMISSSVSVYYFVASSCSSIWCPCNHCLGSVWNSAKTTIWNTRSTIKR